MVFISKEKLRVSAYSATQRPKHVVFLANKHHHLTIFYSCDFLTEFTSPYSLNAQRGWHTSELRVL